MENKVKVISVDGNDTTIDITLTDGSVSRQTVAGIPVHDADLARRALVEYAAAYERGIEVEKQAEAEPEVARGLVGSEFVVE